MIRSGFRAAVLKPICNNWAQICVFCAPSIALGLFFIGGQRALVLCAIIVPTIFLGLWALKGWTRHHHPPQKFDSISNIQTTAHPHKSNLPRSELAHDVANALSTNEIHPWFQPQFDTCSGALVGVEALARWTHPKYGVIPPLQFLDIIHDCGLWPHMTDRILDHSLHAVNVLAGDGIFIPSVGVNFSEHDLAHPDIVDRVQWMLDKHNLPAPRLTIEILETVAANPHDTGHVDVIGKMADLGCRIDLDDFGTGYASIASLRNFRLNRIKIDRSFVGQIDQDPQQHRMLKTIVLMAKQLGFETLAEGVENKAELRVLQHLGCNAVQGFGLGKPMPLAELGPWLRSKGYASQNQSQFTNQNAA